MDIALLLTRLLLASVFVVAGVGKLTDRSGTRQAIADFGVPSPLVAPLGVLLPVATGRSAIASGGCVRSPLDGTRLRATWCWPPWPPSSSGEDMAAQDPAP